MRKLFEILMAAAGLALLPAGCGREALPDTQEEGVTAELSFDVSCFDAQFAATKALGNDPTLAQVENEHDDIDIFVFDAATGGLVGSRHGSTSAMTVPAKGATYNVYAVANLNNRTSTAYTQVTDEASLKAMTVTHAAAPLGSSVPGTVCNSSYVVGIDTDDEDNPSWHYPGSEGSYLTKFLMVSDRKTVSVWTPQTVSLPLKRTVSKLAWKGTVSFQGGVETFENRFVKPVYGDGDGIGVVSLGVFLCSCPRSYSLVNESPQACATSSPTDTWRTMMSFPAPDDASDFLLGWDEAWDNSGWETAKASHKRLDSYTWYYLPENAAAPLTAAQRAADPLATDKCTKIVFAVSVYDSDSSETLDIWYYPIAIPNIGRNESYELNNVTITGPGSDNPFVYPPQSDYHSSISYELTIKDWTTGQLSKIVTGGLNQINEETGTITI